MTLDETKKFLMVMNLFYPNWKPEVSKELIANAWYQDLQDYSKNDIDMAFKIYRSQGNQFPPSQPGVLISLLVENTSNDLPEMQAWDMVARAVRNGIYGAEVEFERLPEDVQKAVGSPAQLREWAQMPTNEVHSVGQSNFLRSYRTVIKRKVEMAKIPQSVRTMLEGVKNEKVLPQL